LNGVGCIGKLRAIINQGKQLQVNLKFIEVEGVREAFGETKVTFDLKGKTVGDLVREVMKYYGVKTEKVFFTNGHYENNLQIIVNWRKYVSPDKMEEFILQDGDTIIFAPLLDGG
jgi:molybdopterin converting factor small subunit